MKKKVFGKVISVISIITLLFTGVIATFPVNAATYHTVYYSAGDHDDVTSATTFSIAIPEGSSFELSHSARFTRPGYELSCWYIETTGEYALCEQPYEMPNHDLYVVAEWDPIEYEIGFAGVGGITADGEKNVYTEATYGETMILPENPFTYSGYVFSGWEYEGVIYEEGDEFEIPAISAGLKIVLAAVWKKQAAVTTKVTTVKVTTTTITTTKATKATTTLGEGQVIKSITQNKEVTIGSQMKFYPSTLINTGDTIDSLEFVFTVDSNYVGTTSFAIGVTLSDGSWKQVDYQGSVIDDNKLVISFGDKEACNLINRSRAFTVACWYAEFTPITFDSVVAIVRESEAATTTTKITTKATTTTTKATTTKATTTKATTTKNITTTTATTTKNVTTTKATTTKVTTTTYTIAASPLTKTITLNKTASMGSMLDIPMDEILNGNEIVESMEVTIKSDNGQIGNYNLGFIMNMANYSSVQVNLSGNVTENEITLPIEISEDKQTFANMNSNMNIGYWWGDNQSITIESIKINYRVEIGDIDKNGVVDVEDLDVLKQFMLGINNSNVIIRFEDADLNEDGLLNVFDCMILERMLSE